jgi:C4-dicarboxylate transporter DctM subunit
MTGFVILVGMFLVAVLLGFPIALSFLLSCLVYIGFDPRLTVGMIPPILFSSLDSFPLLAIPLFIFSGDLMTGGKVSDRLLAFANVLVGRLPGHLGAMTVLGSMFFGAVSGSGPATTAAIGGMMIPEMRKAGYNNGYATSLTAASGFLGVLIPPSIPFVMFGFMTNTSIGDLFIGGLLPGVLIGLLFILWNTYFAKKNHIPASPRGEGKFLTRLWKGFKEAFWALLMPVIILGGIYGGVFTPSEAAAVAVAYAIVVGLFIYHTLTLKSIWALARRSAYTTLTFMLIFVFATVFSKIMTLTNMTQSVMDFLMALTSSKLLILFLINIFLLLLGMVVDPITAILLVAPLFFPLATGYLGLNPVHFGILVVTNLAVGLITPPMAGNLFVAMRLSGASIRECLKPLIPFVLLALGVALLVTYSPTFALCLVRALKGV